MAVPTPSPLPAGAFNPPPGPAPGYAFQAGGAPRPPLAAGTGVKQRKAVLVGCSYMGSDAELRGCINDCECMAFALKKHFNFRDEDIVMLRDDGKERGPDFRSTKINIFRAIQWLMSDLRPGTCLFFHFSGHGSQRPATMGDELDGMDETVLPSDFKSSGQIIDNELNAMLVAPLPPGCVLHCVIDACHSGTALDLPYSTEYRYGQLYWGISAATFKGTRGGTVVQVGACRDTQVAADTSALSGNAYTGAATFAFVQAVERLGPRVSYAALMAQMSMTLQASTSNADAGSGGGGGLLLTFLGGGAASGGGPQVPVLSCDKNLDFNLPLML